MAMTPIGLDIGSTAVRAVELKRAGKIMALEKLGQVLLPPGSMREGEVVNRDAVTEALRVLWQRFGLKNRRVAVGLASQQVVVRQVDLPWLPPEQLRQSLAFQASDHIPLAAEEALLDYLPLGEVTRSDGTRMARILLVAAARGGVKALLDTVVAARLEPVAVDLAAFALARSAAWQSEPGTAEMVVDVGGTVTNIVVHEAGVPRFVRILVMGGSSITEGLQTTLGISYEEAEGAKQNPPTPDAARLVAERAGRIVEEVRGSLDYYRALPEAVPVRRAVLSGGASQLRGLPQRLAEALLVPVEPAHPMQFLRIGKVGLTTEQLAEAEPFLAVPIGLALGAAA